MTYESERDRMVEEQLARRGVFDPRVLRAMRTVPREKFVSPDLEEFAYVDAALPIEADQTISQPLVVAVMIQLLDLEEGDSVLEVGSGSGYAVAVLSRIVKQVSGIERHRVLVTHSKHRLAELGYDNVEIFAGDGTKGLPERAPFDAILVSAGAKKIPLDLLEQLRPGGRMIIPVGSRAEQRLIRITKTKAGDFEREEFDLVQFVPLVQEQESVAQPSKSVSSNRAFSRSGNAVSRASGLGGLVRESAEQFDSMSDVDRSGLMERVGDARLVLLGEATHGTSEFYRMRAEITQALILRRGFSFIAIEGDWPDVRHLDRYVRDLHEARPPGEPFSGFPAWMWRNREFLELVEWLREYNREQKTPDRKVALYGMDLYSLHASLAATLDYLESVDLASAQVARAASQCLSPWQGDPVAYGRAVANGLSAGCEPEVVNLLTRLFEARMEFGSQSAAALFNALQNARVVKNAEKYYRAMYRGTRESWNLRDSHMFETLQILLEHHGEDAKGIVWAHNSHLGDARATEMGRHGEHNVGQLAREVFGEGAYLIGFGTDRGTVTAASEWGGEAQTMNLRPARADSYEGVCATTGLPAFLLPLRHPRRDDLHAELSESRLERAVGVIYHPETELVSHYFQAKLPDQFDEYIWFSESEAVTPLGYARGSSTDFPFAIHET